MSEILLPDGSLAAASKEHAAAVRDNAIEQARKAKMIPKPATYHLLCVVPEIQKTFESGIVKADQTVAREEFTSTVLCVLALGPDAFKDPKRFPNGPSCKEGEFVIVRPHAGTRVVIMGKEFRIINDDTVEAVVEDPRGINRKE